MTTTCWQRNSWCVSKSDILTACILIVDDDVQLTRQIAAALTEAGHDPVIVHDGEAAVNQGVGNSFDLIVLDLRLPHLNGFEVLRHLRSRHVTSQVLILTARGW